MKDYNDLYNTFSQLNAMNERRKFNYFMNGLEGGLVNDLNKAYASGDMNEYDRIVANIKKKGIRIFRNSEGKHKLNFEGLAGF